MMACIGVSAASYAATEPQAGIYVVSGKVTAVAVRGGATCLATGTAVQGYSYFPGVQGKGKNFTIVIPPVNPKSGIVYSFPPMNTFSGSVWLGLVSYVLPPSVETRGASFSLSFTAYNASSFTILLQTYTVSQGAGPSGSACLTKYSLNFTLGLPTKLF